MNKKDFLLLVWVAMICISVALVTVFYINNLTDSCTADPLKFAVDKIRKEIKPDLIHGSISIIMPNGYTQTDYFGDNVTLKK